MFFKILFLIAAVSLQLHSAMCEVVEQPGPVLKVLAFGGNGFIGSEVLNKLFEDPHQLYSVSLVSRGNWYYDSATRIKPKLSRHIVCDREESDLEYCEELVSFVRGGRIDIVLDFSSYSPSVVEATLELLGNADVGLYVYISSDSVYEVCRASVVPRLASEEDDVRPEDEEERQHAIEGDAYGHDKLLGEELIRSQSKIPWLIFRLPDVLGPRDTTDRWWTYQLWIQLYPFLNLPLIIPPENRKLKTSYVYVKDVAEGISAGIKRPEAWGEVYNLGLEEPLTLQEFLGKMAAELGVLVDYDSGEFSLFPSVTRGAVSIRKAKERLGFLPTSWETVMKETVEFYKEAFYKYTSERDDAAHQLTRSVVPKHRKGEFLRLIDEMTADPSKSLQDILGTMQPSGRANAEEQVTPEQLFQEMMSRTEL